MDNQTMGQRIREMRKRRELSQQALAEKIGRTKGTISQWEAGITHPGGEILLLLATALQCSPHWIVSGEERAREPKGRYFVEGAATDGVEQNVSPAPSMAGLVPEISWVQAGAWTEVCHVELDPEAINWYPRPPGASDRTFVLRVVGDSMLPEYTPGRLIFVDPERLPQSGDDVVAIMTETGEATFKRFIEEPGSGKMLKAINPAWHMPYITINGNCRLVGVVVADMRMR